MKKLIALTTLVAAGSSMANTTETKIDVKDMSIADRISYSYFMEFDKDRLNEDKVSSPDAEIYQSFTMKYKLTNDLTASINPRFSMTDDNPADNFQEHDVRVGIKKSNLFAMANGAITGSATLKLELPTSKGSQDSDKITKIKAYLGVNAKIDNYNNLFVMPYLNKSINSQASDSVAEYSRHNISTYISYSNSALSETAKFRSDVELSHSHIAGNADNSLMADAGDERILAGVDFDVKGTSVYPYVSHDPSTVKAANNLGAGIQVDASF